MKQKLRIVALSMACLPGLLLADSYYTQTPTSKQVYRDVNSAQATSLSTQSPGDSQSTQNPNAAQYQINDNHIAYLSNKTDSMMVQINSLNHMVAMLGQEIDRLKAAKGGKAGNANSTLAFWESGFSWVESVGSTAYMNLGGAALLLVGVGYVVGRTRRPSAKATKAKMAAVATGDDDTKDTEAEYDFMATDEAIPAQLDLARSYLAMDDTEQAKAVLEKVMVRGNDAQKSEAKSLLDEIANKATKKEHS